MTPDPVLGCDLCDSQVTSLPYLLVSRQALSRKKKKKIGLIMLNLSVGEIQEAVDACSVLFGMRRVYHKISNLCWERP